MNSNNSYEDRGDKPQTPNKDRKLKVGKSLTSVQKTVEDNVVAIIAENTLDVSSALSGPEPPSLGI